MGGAGGGGRGVGGGDNTHAYAGQLNTSLSRD